MREELGLARLAEEPVLVLPPFACDLGLTVGTEGCQLHPKTPFTVISNESHRPRQVGVMDAACSKITNSLPSLDK